MFTLMKKLFAFLDKKAKSNEFYESLADGLVIGLVTGLVIGLVVGLVIGLVDGLVIGLVTGLVIGLVIGLVAGLVAGLGDGLGVGLGVLLGFVPAFSLFILIGWTVSLFGALPVLGVLLGVIALPEVSLIHSLVGRIWRKIRGVPWSKDSSPREGVFLSLHSALEALRQDLRALGSRNLPVFSEVEVLLRSVRGMEKVHRTLISAQDSASSDVARRRYDEEVRTLTESIPLAMEKVSALQVEIARLLSEREVVSAERVISSLGVNSFLEAVENLGCETEGLREVSEVSPPGDPLAREIEGLDSEEVVPLRRKSSL